MNNSRNNKNNKRQNATDHVIDLKRNVCPDSITVPISYYTSGGFSGAYTGENIYSLNSAYDPDYTGTGAQPLGFDQWCAFYARYRVDKVDVEVDFVNLSTSSALNCLVVANNANTPINTQATFFAASESPFSLTRVLPTSGGNSTCRLKRTFDIASLLGVSKQRHRSNPDYSGTVAASPTEGVFLHLVLQDLVFNNNIHGQFRVKVTMHTTFFDRTQLTSS